MISRSNKKNPFWAMVVLGASLLVFSTLPATASGLSDVSALATKGLQLAPVQLNYNPSNWQQVGYGSYLVNSFGCYTCHTAKMDVGGNVQYDYGTYFGGVCTAAGYCTKDLRPDAFGMPGGYDVQSFVSAFHGSGGPWDVTFYHSPFFASGGQSASDCFSWYIGLPLGSNGFPYGFTGYDCIGNYCGFYRDDGKFFGGAVCDSCTAFTPMGPGYPFTLSDSDLAAIYSYLQAMGPPVSNPIPVPPINSGPCLSVSLTYPGTNWVWANNITGDILRWDGVQWVYLGSTSSVNNCMSFNTPMPYKQMLKAGVESSQCAPKVGVSFAAPLLNSWLTVSPTTGNVLRWDGTQWVFVGTASAGAVPIF